MAETIPKRVLHNQDLYRRFMETNGIKSTVRPVFRQHESIIINRHALSNFGYNPSIIRFQGRLLMSYRWHSTGTASTQLAIAELDDKFNVQKNSPIQIGIPAISVEDGRLFVFNGELYLSYVEVTASAVVVKYGLLVEHSGWKCLGIEQPKIGTNDGSKWVKNLVFWDHHGKLMCLYESQPETVIYELDGDRPVQEYISPGSFWPYNEIRGGALISYNNKLLRFFHSSQEYDLPPDVRRKYVGVMLMEQSPPFATIQINRKPIVIASEICDLKETDRSQCSHYCPKAVFPAGVLETKDGWWLSCGTNDSGCVLLKIKADQLGFI